MTISTPASITGWTKPSASASTTASACRATAGCTVGWHAVRLTVAPLRFGAGIKSKVIDSFAAGLPCVMTRVAAEGLALTGSLPQLVGDDPGGSYRFRRISR
ncbi:MAG TPA: hypothetical protein VGS13_07090 [Stellaceae bacterium]|nr:hypothetical protein [Stellaceae bacterium]